MSDFVKENNALTSIVSSGRCAVEGDGEERKGRKERQGSDAWRKEKSDFCEIAFSAKFCEGSMGIFLSRIY